VQGAAAELFKVWAAIVRARLTELPELPELMELTGLTDKTREPARIVLCLHDELLVHAPIEHGETVARVVEDGLQEAAHRWAPHTAARFVADISVIERWADAKA